MKKALQVVTAVLLLAGVGCEKKAQSEYPGMAFYCSSDQTCLMGAPGAEPPEGGTPQSSAWCIPTGMSWLCYAEATACKRERRPEWGACRRVTPNQLLAK
jgi:hypothetical protein